MVHISAGRSAAPAHSPPSTASAPRRSHERVCFWQKRKRGSPPLSAAVTAPVVSHVAARSSRRRMNTPRNTASSSSRVAVSLRRTRSQPAANIIQACTRDRLRHLKLPGMLIASAAGSLQMTASDTRTRRNKATVSCATVPGQSRLAAMSYSGTDYRPIQDRLQHVRTLANPYPTRHHRNLLSV